MIPDNKNNLPMVKKERVLILNEGIKKDGPVIYWMSRDQRVEDNWALLYAQELSEKHNEALAVTFCLSPWFPGATLRHYDFMLKGLKEMASVLLQKNIPFYLLMGEPVSEMSDFIEQNGVSRVVTDFDPLRIKRKWKNELAEQTNIRLYEVDAHNLVPCRHVSQKCEFGAYTIRPRIKRLLPLFTDEFSSPVKQTNTGNFKMQKTDWEHALMFPVPDTSVAPVDWLKPGTAAGMEVMNEFLGQKLSEYNEKRNDPNEAVISNLSPYLHFGQLSAQRVALEIMKHHKGDPNSDSFLEELIIRRELSDNYCFYNTDYDSFTGFPEWARKTLNEHRKDEREYIYDFKSFENARTHDLLWNAAQSEMVKSGKMHGYMRMYWAKKILEWTKSPEEALDFSIRLNDKYQLDGRDPNGYVGCAWSVGGVHDRAWAERPVYGKIRYMNYNGCKRKFDVESYIRKWIKNGGD